MITNDEIKRMVDIIERTCSNKSNMAENYFKEEILAKIPELLDELLAYRNSEIEETEYSEKIENEADEMTIYEGNVYITNNYHMIDPEQYMQYKEQLKEQLRKEWEQNMKAMFSYDPAKTND